MNKLHAHTLFMKEHLIATICMILCLYFSYHILNGERGILRVVALEKKIETLSQKHTSLTAEKSILERKVTMMRPGSVDKDLLEERVRLTLGYRYDNEYSILSN